MVRREQKIILLVEDEILIAMDEKNELEEAGYEVITAHSGEESIEIFRKNNAIDIVLMDINLGKGIDGTEAALIILKERKIPVVFLSSHTEPEIVDKTEKITSYGYVVKNSGITVLDASIKMAFKLFAANKKTEIQKEQLKTILNSISDAVIAADVKGKIIQMNPVAENLTGWMFNEAYGKPLTGVFNIVNAQTRELAKNPVELVLTSGTVIGLTNQSLLISKDSREYQIADSGAPIKTADGEITGVAIVFRDVTQEYKIRKKIEESEAQLSNAMKIAKLGYWEYDVDSDLFTFNDSFYAIFHTTADKIGGYTIPSAQYIDKFVHPEDKTMVSEEIRKALKTTDLNFSRQLEHRIVYADGGIGYMNVRFFIVKEAHGRTIKTFGANQDITERKRAEEAVQKSENNFRLLVENAPYAIFIRSQLNFSYLNQAALRLFGADSPGQMIGQPVLDRIHPEFREQARERMKMLDDRKIEVPLIEQKYLKLDGTIIDVEISAVPFIYEGNNGALVFVRDISRWKFIMKELQESEEHFRTVIENASVGVCIVGLDKKFITTNQVMSEMLGYTQEEFRQFTFNDITFFEDREISSSMTQSLLSGERDKFSFEKRYINKDGNVVWGLVSSSLIRDRENKPKYFVTHVQEITGRKRIEEALRTSEQLFRLCLKNVPVTVATQDLNLKFLWAYNQRTVDPKSIIGKTDADVFIPEDAQRLTALKKRVLSEGHELQEEIWLTRNGKQMCLNIFIEPLLDENGNINGIGMATIDLTQTRLAEKALRENELKYRSLFKSIDQGFYLSQILYDDDGNPCDYLYIDVNPAFEKIAGLNQEQIIGKTYNELVPSDSQSGWLECFKRVVMTGIPENYTFYSEIYKRYFETYAFKPEEWEFAALVKDVTDRMAADDRIKALLKEKEIILKEVHHRIKNNMNVIYSLLKLQINIQKKSESKKALQDASTRVRSMMILYDKLYRSENFESLSLKEYLSSLFSDIFEIFPKKASIQIKTRIEDIILDAKVLSSIGLIMNELVTNAMKYAFTGLNNGIITVTAVKKRNMVSLIFEDNGPGLPETVTPENSSGFGLQLVGLLVKQIDGAITINRDKGTKFIIEFEV